MFTTTSPTPILFPPVLLSLLCLSLDSPALSLHPPHSPKNMPATWPGAPWAGWSGTAPTPAAPRSVPYCGSLGSTTDGKVLGAGPEPPGAQLPPGSRTAGSAGGKAPECGSHSPVNCMSVPMWDLPPPLSQSCLHFQEWGPAKLHPCWP